MLERVVAMVRANPALAIAGVAVGGVLVLPMFRRDEPEPAEAAEPADVYGPGYGAALTDWSGGPLESDAISSQLNEGNNFLLGQIGELRALIEAGQRDKTDPGVGRGRGGMIPTPRPLPGLPGKVAARGTRRIGALRDRRALNRTEVAAILALWGHPRWDPPASARRSPGALITWIRAERVRRAARRRERAADRQLSGAG